MIGRRAHGAPLERKMIHDYGYKHGAPSEHCTRSHQGINHFSGKAPRTLRP